MYNYKQICLETKKETLTDRFKRLLLSNKDILTNVKSIKDISQVNNKDIQEFMLGIEKEIEMENDQIQNMSRVIKKKEEYLGYYMKCFMVLNEIRNMFELFLQM
jgi:hypothetical protein